MAMNLAFIGLKGHVGTVLAGPLRDAARSEVEQLLET
jgi:hypothetical protein